MKQSMQTKKSESQLAGLKPTEQSASSETKPEIVLPERDAHGYWKPGQSGNPGGRPKRTPLIDACREVLSHPVPDDPGGRTYAQAIADKLADMARNGDVEAMRALADRAEGKPRQTIGIENATLKQAFERMSDAELDAYAREGKLPDWFPQTTEAIDETVQ